MKRFKADGPVYELRFDGSCSPNPGGVCRYGWVVWKHRPDRDAEVIAEGSGPVPVPVGQQTTCNLAEWAALRAGLFWLSHLRAPFGRLLIRGDSLLVIGQLTGETKCRAPHLKVHRDACRAILEAMRHRWAAEWVPREENAAADRLAAVVN